MSCAAAGSCIDLGPNDFQRDRDAEFGVPGLIHRTHSADTELREGCDSASQSAVRSRAVHERLPGGRRRTPGVLWYRESARSLAAVVARIAFLRRRGLMRTADRRRWLRLRRSIPTILCLFR